MPGVKIIERNAFYDCRSLTDVECDKLEIIGHCAFCHCSLRKINLSSARIVQEDAFACCNALTDVKFGSKLERIDESAFILCEALEQITIPLKDGSITTDNIFMCCNNLRHVHLVEGKLQETIAALHLEEWRDDMKKEIDSINQILPNAHAGNWDYNEGERVVENVDLGEKAGAIRRWIRSVLHKITDYKAEHRHLLNEAATTLEVFLPNDIVTNKGLSFLNLPPHTFEEDDGEDGEEEDT